MIYGQSVVVVIDILKEVGVINYVDCFFVAIYHLVDCIKFS